MSLVKIEWNPPDRQLKQFGWCALVALPIIAWMFIGWTLPGAWQAADWRFFGWFAGVGAVFAALAVMWPAGLKPIFLAASVVTIPIGMVISEAVLLLIYFAVFTPVALIFKLIGRDVLHRGFEPAAATYWVPKTQPADALQYFRQS